MYRKAKSEFDVIKFGTYCAHKSSLRELDKLERKRFHNNWDMKHNSFWEQWCEWNLFNKNHLRGNYRYWWERREIRAEFDVYEDKIWIWRNQAWNILHINLLYLITNNTFSLYSSIQPCHVSFVTLEESIFHDHNLNWRKIQKTKQIRANFLCENLRCPVLCKKVSTYI